MQEEKESRRLKLRQSSSTPFTPLRLMREIVLFCFVFERCGHGSFKASRDAHALSQASEHGVTNSF
jgi:hypothetical protein